MSECIVFVFYAVLLSSQVVRQPRNSITGTYQILEVITHYCILILVGCDTTPVQLLLFLSYITVPTSVFGFDENK